MKKMFELLFTQGQMVLWYWEFGSLKYRTQNPCNTRHEIAPPNGNEPVLTSTCLIPRQETKSNSCPRSLWGGTWFQTKSGARKCDLESTMPEGLWCGSSPKKFKGNSVQSLSNGPAWTELNLGIVIITCITVLLVKGREGFKSRVK